MREIRTSGSEGDRGGKPPWSTRLLPDLDFHFSWRLLLGWSTEPVQPGSPLFGALTLPRTSSVDARGSVDQLSPGDNFENFEWLEIGFYSPELALPKT